VEPSHDGILDEIAGLVLSLVAVSVETKGRGLRLRDQDGHFPFFRSDGYSDAFVSDGRSCLRGGNDEPLMTCLCGAVLSRTDAMVSDHFTPFGSYWQSDWDQFASSGGIDCAAEACKREGLTSLALVPVETSQGCQGMLHVGDEHSRRIGLDDVAKLEEVASYLARCLTKLGEMRESRALAPHQILVVDDDPAVRRVLVRLLTTLGHHCHEASDGQDALEQLQGLKVDLLWTDLEMPVMKGIELIGAIRERYGPYGPRVIVCTGYPGSVSTAELESYRIGALVRKPLGSVVELGSVIAKVFGEQPN